MISIDERSPSLTNSTELRIRTTKHQQSRQVTQLYKSQRPHQKENRTLERKHKDQCWDAEAVEYARAQNRYSHGNITREVRETTWMLVTHQDLRC